MKTREYYVLPVDSFGQPIGYIETIKTTLKDYRNRKENGEYIYKEYSQALFRAQDQEVHRMELEYKIIVAMAKEIAELRDGLDAEYGENNPENYDIEKIIAQYKEEAEKEIKEEE